MLSANLQTTPLQDKLGETVISTVKEFREWLTQIPDDNLVHGGGMIISSTGSLSRSFRVEAIAERPDHEGPATEVIGPS